LAERRHRPAPVTDPRKFLFGLQCRYCLSKYNTLQQAKQHFTQECSWLPSVKIKCECCSTTFRHWGKCTVHLNVKGAHLRKRPKVIVVSTTSSSEGEAAPTKTETRSDSPMVARREVHSPARQPSPTLVVSSTPPPPSTTDDTTADPGNGPRSPTGAQGGDSDRQRPPAAPGLLRRQPGAVAGGLRVHHLHVAPQLREGVATGSPGQPRRCEDVAPSTQVRTLRPPPNTSDSPFAKTAPPLCA